jgi:hypothetical protein
MFVRRLTPPLDPKSPQNFPSFRTYRRAAKAFNPLSLGSARLSFFSSGILDFTV